MLDADGDHIPDDWEIANGFDPNLKADGALDSDGDNFTNYQEYLAGTDPHDSTSYLKVDSISGTPGTATLTFIARSNKTYTVLFKNSLSDATWQSLSNLFARATNRLETVTDPAIGNGSRVYRLITPYQQ